MYIACTHAHKSNLLHFILLLHPWSDHTITRSELKVVVIVLFRPNTNNLSDVATIVDVELLLLVSRH